MDLKKIETAARRLAADPEWVGALIAYSTHVTPADVLEMCDLIRKQEAANAEQDALIAAQVATIDKLTEQRDNAEKTAADMAQLHVVSAAAEGAKGVPVQAGSVDTPEFGKLVSAVEGASLLGGGRYMSQTWLDLIAHIDAHTARAVAAAEEEAVRDMVPLSVDGRSVFLDGFGILDIVYPPAAPQQHAQAAEQIVQVLLYMSGNGLIKWQGTGNDEDDAWNSEEEYRTTLDAVRKGLAASQHAQAALSDDLDLIRACIEGYPASPARNTALATIRKVLASHQPAAEPSAPECTVCHGEGMVIVELNEHQACTACQDIEDDSAAAPAIKQEGAALKQTDAEKEAMPKGRAAQECRDEQTVYCWSELVEFGDARYQQGRAALAASPAQPKPPADAAPVNAKPAVKVIREYFAGRDHWDFKVMDESLKNGDLLHAMPPAAVQQGSERDAALKNICAAVEVNDTDSMAMLSKDSEVIWTATGSWAKPASVTLGDLRAVAEMAAQQGKKAPGAA